jgi:hypothetical protein
MMQVRTIHSWQSTIDSLETIAPVLQLCNINGLLTTVNRQL